MHFQLEKKLLHFILVLFVSTFTNSCTNHSNKEEYKISLVGALDRFVAANNYLYVVHDGKITVYDITDAYNPNTVHELSLNSEAGGVLLLKNKIAAQVNGEMQMFNISNPKFPVLVGSTNFLTPCSKVTNSPYNDSIYTVIDPKESICGRQSNNVQILKSKNVLDAEILSNKKLDYPFSTCFIDTTIIAVCDKKMGLVLVDIKDTSQTNSIQTITSDTFLDAYLLDTVLICRTSKGIVYLNASNKSKLTLLSRLE